MLKYIENTTADNITNKDIHTIHEFVEKAKHRKEVGINYMKIWEEKYLARKEALREGREEGREEGRKEVIGAFIEACRDLGQMREKTVSIIIEKIGMPKEEAEDCVNIYWKN